MGPARGSRSGTQYSVARAKTHVFRANVMNPGRDPCRGGIPMPNGLPESFGAFGESLRAFGQGPEAVRSWDLFAGNGGVAQLVRAAES
jgi:hypothetical protein